MSSSDPKNQGVNALIQNFDKTRQRSKLDSDLNNSGSQTKHIKPLNLDKSPVNKQEHKNGPILDTTPQFKYNVNTPTPASKLGIGSAGKKLLSFNIHILYLQTYNPLSPFKMKRIDLDNDCGLTQDITYVSLSNQSLDCLFQLKFLIMTNEQPFRKQDTSLILGPYGFKSLREISLSKLWSLGYWNINEITGRLVRANKNFSFEKVKV